MMDHRHTERNKTMSKRTKMLIAGAATMVATSLSVSAPALVAAAQGVAPQMTDHSWCC